MTTQTNIIACNVKPKCENCRYFEDDQPHSGFCQKNPPYRDYAWPKVGKDDWCGEFTVDISRAQALTIHEKDE